MIDFSNRRVVIRAQFILNFLVALLLTTGCSVIAIGADRGEANPLDFEPIQSLRKTLGRTCTISFKNGNLRSGVASLEKEYGIRVWLDARIDLDASSDFLSSGKSLAIALDSLAALQKATPVWIGDTVYFAPTESAGAIESAYWRMYRNWPSSRLSANEFEWTMPTSPRELLEKWSEQNQWKLIGSEAVEYDLWSGKTLPDGNAPAQLACLLSGLGMEANIDEGAKLLTLVPIAAEMSFACNYKPERIDSKLIARWKKNWPRATIVRSGIVQVVQASPAAQRELVAFPLTPKSLSPNEKDPLALERFSLKFKGRLLPVLEELRRGPQITFEPWPLPMQIQDRPVETNFKNATIDNVLEELGRQAKIGFTRNGLNVTIEIP
jgi:hypothetical protein